MESPNGEGEGGRRRVAQRNEEQEEEDGDKEGKVPADNEGGRHSRLWRLTIPLLFTSWTYY